jgi:hypothetical protein
MKESLKARLHLSGYHGEAVEEIAKGLDIFLSQSRIVYGCRCLSSWRLRSGDID